MTATRVRDLLATAAVAAVLSAILVYQLYGELPSFSWYTGAWLAVLAGVEWWYGRIVRAAIRREPGARPIQPLVAARALVLAKASSIFGAVMAGLWAGLLAYTVPRLGYLSSAAGDTTTAGIGLVAGVALVVAGLWLEHCCRAPEPPDDSQSDGSSADDSDTDSGWSG